MVSQSHGGFESSDACFNLTGHIATIDPKPLSGPIHQGRSTYYTAFDNTGVSSQIDLGTLR